MPLIIENGIIQVEECDQRICFPGPTGESSPEYAALVAVNLQLAAFLKLLRSMPAQQQNARADATAAVDHAMDRMQGMLKSVGASAVSVPVGPNGGS